MLLSLLERRLSLYTRHSFHLLAGCKPKNTTEIPGCTVKFSSMDEEICLFCCTFTAFLALLGLSCGNCTQMCFENTSLCHFRQIYVLAYLDFESRNTNSILETNQFHNSTRKTEILERNNLFDTKNHPIVLKFIEIVFKMDRNHANMHQIVLFWPRNGCFLCLFGGI